VSNNSCGGVSTFKKQAKQTCKPSSVLRIIGAVTIYLALMLPSGSSDLPGDRPGVLMSLCLVLLRMGFT